MRVWRPEIPRKDGIDHFGLIDTGRVTEIVRNIGIGCMLARAEVAGISRLQYLRMAAPFLPGS